MVYPTLKAIVREGQIQLIDEVDLPENAILLVTVIDEAAIGTLSLGEQIIAGLHDLRLGRVTEIVTSSDLNKHLDQLFDED